ncbi:DNA repair protein RecO [Aliifodinibius sp. S!AR15-10]|uniref:DNA repair protein RecO n=1 Tax=Aliifodinibius sp. S!AR15-10 TaxID=2950437 RepID=UPI0028648F67|nr:DNA repair protein RecO [Aliifodinibius sp. S!AR15-10]MDR8391161.1 DNA repair protein RecO [Aliifodinibius sp. S!AR15-10]
MITHTSAIVFRTVDYSESSKIVTLFTEEHGKIAVMVRGVKKPKSKFSGLMEVGNLLDVVYYYKSSRSVQTLSEASYLEKTFNIRTNFEKIATLTSAIELMNQLLHDEEVNLPIFEVGKRFILWLNETDQSPQQIFPYLQIRLAELVGHGLQLHIKNEDDETPQSQYFFNLETGLISTDSAASYSYKLTQNQFMYVRLALQSRSSRLMEIDFETGELKHWIEHLDRYFKYHVEGFRNRKSDAIFEQLLQE